MQPRAPYQSTQSAAAGADAPLEQIKKLALSRPVEYGALDRLCTGGIAVIAEIDPTDPAAADLVSRFEDGRVRAIAFSAGSLTARAERMVHIRTHTHVPLLCLEPADTSHQLWQARACGADLIVLRAATLSDLALFSLVERAASIGMEALVEVRTGADLVRALRAQARGVLLRPSADAIPGTPQADLHDLLSMVPDGVVKVAECGPGGRSDLIACARNGADAVLLGARLLTCPDPGSVVADLAAMGAHPALSRRGSRTV
ncbi:Indole-3-glycerol phosphate synthase [Catenulispora acidiphila DSM 44928]|uniref:indole-3-glycerol-phosphate synthase n=1 Tax=Catenulispora acidiphila (strain DSM 44928 / JCM 14897 / NBRC 102108 / NRRL B-24433 / ID139908) TaxID=479433 RepID=C7Q4D7_CATAD|nr:Indole-3-glycerol phosphate synthase [Catenulispora acidiphila DSM 44928]